MRRFLHLSILLVLVWSCTSVTAMGATGPQSSAPKPGLHGFLVYPDGNKVSGVLLSLTGEQITVDTDRFGRIAVPIDDAEFLADEQSRIEDILPESLDEASKRSDAASQTRESPPPSEAEEETEDGGFFQKLAAWWQPYEGRLSAFALTGDDGGSQRNDYFLSMRVRRKLKNDTYEGEGRFEYQEVDSKLNKQRFTFRGNWEHVITPRWYSLYRPYFEYDQLPVGVLTTAYWLTQQQVGMGYVLYNSDRFSSRVAVSGNYFLLRYMDISGSSSEWAPSTSIENKLKLPWNFDLNQKGQFYLWQNLGVIGFENETDLVRRFNKSFSITLRHEYRVDFPALNANDYNRFRFLVNWDY